jgi:hypothetical protein
MSIQFSRSLRPLLIGSLVLASFACRRDADRSNSVDPASSTPAARNSESPVLPSTMPDQRPGSTDLDRNERRPVAGRDDMVELGNGGSTGMGGSGGWGGSSHH